MSKIPLSIYLLTLLLLLLTLTTTVSSTKPYKQQDVIPVYASKVGPYHNPSEIYAYYDHTPFCRPDELVAKDQGLGEIIEGDKKSSTVYQFGYLESVNKKVGCSKKFSVEDVTLLKHLITRNFYYEFEIDGISTKNAFGYFEEQKNALPNHYLFTHLIFNVLYNSVEDKSGHIIYVNITSDPASLVLLNENSRKEITFTYSVKWQSINVPYSLRNHYAIGLHQNDNLRVHWLSIVNSLILVFLLIGFIAVILIRTLRKDYIVFEEEENDYGWKVIGRDVFRTPKYWSILTAFIGVGGQFFLMTTFVLLFAIIGFYYPSNDGALFVSIIILYAVTSAFGGFAANYLHISWKGNSWVWTTVLTAVIFVIPFFIIAFFANMVAVIYGAANALPFGTMMAIVSIWALAGFPLTVIGGIIGKRIAPEAVPPIPPKTTARQMPILPLIASFPVKLTIAGFLPFSSIYIELFYLFDAIWAFAVYQLWGILLIVFLILITVTVCISISLTYFQISNEDYRWWWHSFLNGTSTGIYIYLYALYYFTFQTNMEGFLQTTFYFGYTFVICYFFAIMLGTVSFFASFYFMKRIYSAIPSK